MPNEEHRHAETLSVSFAGPNGRQRLVITVGDQHGSPLSNWPVVILDHHSGDIVRARTGDDGVYVHETHFDDGRRTFEVSSVAKLKEVFVLLGPRS